MAAEKSTMPILRVRNLVIRVKGDDGQVFYPVDDVSFSLRKGETLAVVGESGSGKSLTAMALTRLLPDPPLSIESGEIVFDGDDILKMSPGKLRKLRGRRIAYVFQEPSTSLNPVYSIRNQMAEVIKMHRPEVKDIDKEIIDWLYQVGIVAPEERMRDYPHQLSGGMQQRVMIAMALCCRPDVLVADEPTTALDVTVQAQILKLLADLQKRHEMAILLITHNFGIIQSIADRVAVMFRGHLVEEGPATQVIRRPQHPYTKALIRCIPMIGDTRKRLATIDYSEIEKFEEEAVL